MNQYTVQTPTKRRNLDWLPQAFLVFMFLYLAQSNWFEKDLVPTPFLPSIALIGVILLIAIAGILAQRFLSRKSWASIFSLSGRIELRDEREWQLFGRASQYAFGASFLVVMLAATVILVAPSASKVAIVYFLFTVFELQLGIRGFISWALGLR